MKTTIGIIVGVILGSLLFFGCLVFFLFSFIFPLNWDSSIDTSLPVVVDIPADSPPAVSNTNSDQLPAKVTPAPATPPPDKGKNTNDDLSPSSGSTPEAPVVKFTLGIVSFNISGMSSGTVVTQIANNSNIDAHNSWIKVKIYSKDNNLIKIDGQDYYRKDLGTIKAASTITSQATITVNPLDGMRILSNGAMFHITITADEATQSLTYQVSPQDIFP